MSTTAIKERPILFSGPMVRAILEGRKTQTRRVVKGRGAWSVEDAGDGSGRTWPGYMDELGTWCDMPCPYGQPGDRLWVRETWRQTIDDKSFVVVQYRADETIRLQLNDHGGEGDPIGTREHKEPMQRVGRNGPTWKRSIHMPRWASRITLEITGVRVERLQDISEADRLAEGATKDRPFGTVWRAINTTPGTRWEDNPWVWVVEFKRV